MNRFIKWHNSQIDWWKKKLNVSWYAMNWISFFKGVLLVLIILAFTGCSIKEPRLTLGKKCVEKNDSIVYSYLWIFDKQDGLEANKETCKNIRD